MAASFVLVIILFASTNTMFFFFFFFSIYIGSIVSGLCIPWTYHSRCQLLSMQHGLLLLIECMRLLPKPDLPRVTFTCLPLKAHFNFFSRLSAGRSMMLIVPPSTTKCELQF